MTTLRLIALAAASGFVLAACAPPADQTPAPTPPPVETAPETEIPVTPESAPETPATDATADQCAVLDSRDWEAWINRMPGPDATVSVHVVGKVDVRSGGYTFNWEVGPMDRSMTPTLNLKLTPVAPTEPATMAISTEEVQYTGPLAGSSYRGVTVTCGGQTLAEITEVPDVH